jgi:hypothetical protein
LVDRSLRCTIGGMAGAVVGGVAAAIEGPILANKLAGFDVFSGWNVILRIGLLILCGVAGGTVGWLTTRMTLGCYRRASKP